MLVVWLRQIKVEVGEVTMKGSRQNASTIGSAHQTTSPSPSQHSLSPKVTICQKKCFLSILMYSIYGELCEVGALAIFLGEVSYPVSPYVVVYFYWLR